MGQNLSQPVTDKYSDRGENASYYFGVSSMQGWRVSMEDAHATILDLPVGGERATDEQAENKATQKTQTAAYFAVYDGHGGDRTALYAGDHTHNLIAKSAAYAKQQWGKALQDGFLATDRAVADHYGVGMDASGCAATGVLITDDVIVCGNSGDSRTVLGTLGTAKALSFDHKPDNEGERSRINNAGGFVEMSRVNGNLALSRAFGDFSFKKNAELPPEEQVVTAYPDIISHPLSDQDEFVVIACDGIWDCMTSQEVVEFVRRGVAEKMPLDEICELLIEECLAPESDMTGIGCDNMTACVVALLRDKSKEEWYQQVADRVAAGKGPVLPRTTAEIRSHISARSRNSNEGDNFVEVDGQSPHLMLQQFFGGSNGNRLNPEATEVLSRLGIRFLNPDEAEDGQYSDEEEGSNQEDHDEEGKTPRDDWQ